ncbi:DUF2255 family protein [Nonomuraea sp. M3C6]|uniref:DUF2255 family protein n=1 Tax=Nonomuraea marmarensis TaxID=3351344 RepID=A0ABW7AUD7_9ACTN
MTTWTSAEQQILTSSGSLTLTLTAGDRDQPSVEVGMVLVNGQLYVRAYQGARSHWYQAAKHHGHGHVHLGALTRDVLLRTAIGYEPADAIDTAYHTKYGGRGSITTTPTARSATIHISPTQSGSQ